MAYAETNATTVSCHDCQTELEPGAAIQSGFWGGETFFCHDCKTKRDAEAETARQRQSRQGLVLLSILPAIEKQGIVSKIEGGVGHYSSEVRVEIRGHVYTVQVIEQDPD